VERARINLSGGRRQPGSGLLARAPANTDPMQAAASGLGKSTSPTTLPSHLLLPRRSVAASGCRRENTLQTDRVGPFCRSAAVRNRERLGGVAMSGMERDLCDADATRGPENGADPNLESDSDSASLGSNPSPPAIMRRNAGSRRRWCATGSRLSSHPAPPLLPSAVPQIILGYYGFSAE
jgi:hypothetical protein